jgi:hypothetical protein
MPFVLHLLQLAFAVLAVCVTSAFVFEADDRAALGTVPRRFARFFGALLVLTAFAYFGPF